ncbi:dTDP-4-dehydrorhamnose reductase [Oceanimonas sp. GK1]|uniref:dTDP-4-dehydrorhamnose reductase n=1 Tax=Oceanimonas sp. (strain GK1 / IBRC-M 10197) TaxID=511062 RepID=UPI0002495129|nr:dTDP-4-dehydrorhamnose reductase [Oceanimonas sp. GK1]AEY02711.1 dTDP-4-dehydrorhamnose reductase [Oceanimonas sp. GK1]
MKILLLGKNGQVGWELQRALAPLGEVIALDRHSQEYCGDLSNLPGLVHTLHTLKPNVIVNAAAYTAVDQAETEHAQATLINAEAVALLAKEACALGAWLVHYSTDYVFNGAGSTPWREEDTPAPLNHYGASKLAGERAVIWHCSRYLLFRTSWVYGARGSNFARTMLRLGKARSTLGVIHDQVGSPTGAALIADVTAHALHKAMQQPELAGLYHLAAAGSASWYDYASLVFEQARKAGIPLALTSLEAIPSSAWQAAAKRPLNSRLDCRRLEAVFELSLPPWQQGLQHTLTVIFGATH